MENSLDIRSGTWETRNDGLSIRLRSRWVSSLTSQATSVMLKVIKLLRERMNEHCVLNVSAPVYPRVIILSFYKGFSGKIFAEKKVKQPEVLELCLLQQKLPVLLTRSCLILTFCAPFFLPSLRC